MYGNVRESILNTQKKTDAFVSIVSELAGQYINLLVIQKFTYIDASLYEKRPHLNYIE